ncbi:hypothetical protein LINGRAHAP2_LOCUS25374 [Linum grandiflorum]
MGGRWWKEAEKVGGWKETEKVGGWKEAKKSNGSGEKGRRRTNIVTLNSAFHLPLPLHKLLVPHFPFLRRLTPPSSSSSAVPRCRPPPKFPNYPHRSNLPSISSIPKQTYRTCTSPPSSFPPHVTIIPHSPSSSATVENFT